jgi:hypothetical protein
VPEHDAPLIDTWPSSRPAAIFVTLLRLPTTVPDAVTVTALALLIAPEMDPETDEEATCSDILNESAADAGMTSARSPSRCTVTSKDADEGADGGPMQRVTDVQMPFWQVEIIECPSVSV